MDSYSGFSQPTTGCPAHQGASRMPLHGPEFAADQDASYTALRQYGPAAPVELAPGVDALLVTDYSMALQVLQNPDTFAKDARRWKAFNEGRIPQNSGVLPMLQYRPNCLFTDGSEHLRLRQAVTDSMSQVDSHLLGRHVERVSTYLINQFSDHGVVDLLNDYAKMLPLLVFNELFGCPPEIGDRLIYGISAIFDGVDAENGNAALTESLLELVALKRSSPGEDVTSWLMGHQAALTDEEMVHQLVMLMSAGTEPQRNLIANGLRLILSDDRYSGGQFGGALLVEDAIDDVLWNSPPMANYAPHYPVHDVELNGVRVNAGELVLISFAAANTDPALSSSRQMLSKRAHLAWSAGPHACPAKDSAQLIAVVAIEKLLNHLPDIELAVPVDQLSWRPGPFHRALTELPARFSPIHSRVPRPGVSGQQQEAVPVGTSPRSGGPGRGGWWSSFLTWWKV